MSDPGPIYRPTEEGIEESVLRWLSGIPILPDALQWTPWNPDSGEGGAKLDEETGREKSEVVYWKILRKQLVQINEEVTEENVGKLLSVLRRQMSHDGLMAGNKAVHRLLLEGQVSWTSAGPEIVLFHSHRTRADVCSATALRV